MRFFSILLDQGDNLMAAQPRLNSVIRALEEGKTPIATFGSPPSVEGAIALSTTAYDDAGKAGGRP